MIEKLMSVLDTSNDNVLYDPLSLDLSKFTWESGYFTHYLSDDDIERFYLVSLAYYGDIVYEDFILILNGIEDIFDLYPGAKIKIPKKSDLDSFILKYSKSGAS